MTQDDSLEIRILKELTEIRLELQELRQKISTNDLQMKVLIADHQAQCPLMSKRLITTENSYQEWQENYKQHLKESGRGFDLLYSRLRNLAAIAVFLYVLLKDTNWAAIREVLR